MRRWKRQGGGAQGLSPPAGAWLLLTLAAPVPPIGPTGGTPGSWMMAHSPHGRLARGRASDLLERHVWHRCALLRGGAPAAGVGPHADLAGRVDGGGVLPGAGVGWGGGRGCSAQMRGAQAARAPGPPLAGTARRPGRRGPPTLAPPGPPTCLLACCTCAGGLVHDGGARGGGLGKGGLRDARGTVSRGWLGLQAVQAASSEREGGAIWGGGRRGVAPDCPPALAAEPRTAHEDCCLAPHRNPSRPGARIAIWQACQSPRATQVSSLTSRATPLAPTRSRACQPADQARVQSQGRRQGPP